MAHRRRGGSGAYVLAFLVLEPGPVRDYPDDDGHLGRRHRPGGRPTGTIRHNGVCRILHMVVLAGWPRVTGRGIRTPTGHRHTKSRTHPYDPVDRGRRDQRRRTDHRAVQHRRRDHRCRPPAPARGYRDRAGRSQRHRRLWPQPRTPESRRGRDRGPQRIPAELAPSTVRAELVGTPGQPTIAPAYRSGVEESPSPAGRRTATMKSESSASGRRSQVDRSRSGTSPAAAASARNRANS